MKHRERSPLPLGRLRALAAEAECDPRTITKRLLGLPIKGLALERVNRVLAKHGYVNLPSEVTVPRKVGGS